MSRGILPQSADNGAFFILYAEGQKNGDPSATRTRDTLIKSQVLYRLS